MGKRIKTKTDGEKIKKTTDDRHFIPLRVAKTTWDKLIKLNSRKSIDTGRNVSLNETCNDVLDSALNEEL